MVINVKKEDVFIPEWNDNRDLPDIDQIKIWHRFLTTAEREQYIYLKNYTEGSAAKLIAATQGGEIDDSAADIFVEYSREFVQDTKGMALAIVTKIENLAIDYGDGKEPIDTIEKFYAAPDAFPQLRAEIEGHMLNLTARADTKNS